MRSILNAARPDNIYGGSAFSTNVGELLADRQFENMVMRKLRLTHDILDVYAEIDAYLRRILKLIDLELK